MPALQERPRPFTHYRFMWGGGLLLLYFPGGFGGGISLCFCAFFALDLLRPKAPPAPKKTYGLVSFKGTAHLEPLLSAGFGAQVPVSIFLISFTFKCRFGPLKRWLKQRKIDLDSRRLYCRTPEK